MPYICLARNDIPNGVLQVLDLDPNTSLALASGPQPQTRYINRPLSQTATVIRTTGGLSSDVRGLAAYLFDRVEPGGLEVAQTTVTMTGPLHGDTVTVASVGGVGGAVLTATANYAVGTIQAVGPIAGDTFDLGMTTFTCVEDVSVGTIQSDSPQDGDTVDVKTVSFSCVENYATGTCQVLVGAAAGDTVTIKGIVFTAVNPGPANPAAQEFDDVAASGSAIVTATSLATTINDPASQALLLAAAPGGVTCAADNAGGATDTVTLTADQRGLQGQFALAESTGGVNFTLSGATMIAVPANPAAQEFDGPLGTAGGTDIEVASTLVTAINDAASQALITAVAPAGVVCTAANGGATLDTVTLTASAPGAQGDFALAESTADARIHLSGAAMTHTDASPAAQEFNSLAHFGAAGTNIQVAATMEAAINDPASPEAVTGAAGGTDTVTLTADDRGLVGELGLAESTAGVRFTLSGANLVMAPCNPALGEFDALAATAGGNAGVAASYQTALTDAAAIALMQLATGGPYVDAAAPGGDVVTMTAVDALAVPLIGPTGNMETASSAPARLVLDNASTTHGVLCRAHQAWEAATQVTAATALQARVDAGLDLTLAQIDASLLATSGAELTTAAGSNSTGLVADILNIMAGRGYKILRTNPQTNAVYQYMLNAYTWVGNHGAFTEPVLVQDGQWGHGEIRPNNIGGDWVNREIAPIRYTVESGSFNLSMGAGTLAVFGAAPWMPPVTLWPDSDFSPHYPWVMQPNAATATVNNAKLLTVYDDAGNVLV